MTRRKTLLMVAATAILVAVTVGLLTRPASPWQQVGDYKVRLVSVESVNHQYEPWEPVHREVWITLDVSRSDGYFADLRRRRGRFFNPYEAEVPYTPSVVRHFTLVTPEGDRLPPMDELPTNPSHLQPLLMKLGIAPSSGVKLVFDNPGHESVAALTADLFDGRDFSNFHTNVASGPKAGTLRFNNIRLP